MSRAAPRPPAGDTLRAGLAHMNGRRYAEARALLAPLARAHPDAADARFLLGAALRHLGDAAAAERELTAAAALAPARPDILVELARLLLASGRPERAIDLLQPVADAGEAPLRLLAEAHAARGEQTARIAVLERLARHYPQQATHLHNLAAALGDAGEMERSEAAARTALAGRAEQPETWLVLARALQGQNRLDEAEAAFHTALRHRNDYVEARRDLSQLLWMRDGDLAAARRTLAADGATPATARALRIIDARLLEIAGHGHEALAGLAGAGDDDPALHRTISHLALATDPSLALDHARRAHRLARDGEPEQRQLVMALIATGEHAEALRRIERLQARRPLDQGLIAAQWTVWRQVGDPRADALYEYSTMVLSQPIDTPRGWSRLDDFLADLAAAVTDLHRLRRHPFDQSLRNGSQTSVNLLTSRDPAIAAFRDALDVPIRAYLARLGTGRDRLRARNRGGSTFAGMWSVRFAAGGFHLDHTHPQGWLSSAFHLALPQRTETADREGWLKFGEPGIRTAGAMPPGHFVEPAAGQLVLFPSYMWHGTTPFAGAGARLSLAFDLVPAVAQRAESAGTVR